jgi:hypothetical protein
LIDATKLNLDKQVNIAGFYVPAKGTSKENKEQKTNAELDDVNKEVEEIEKTLDENLNFKNELKVIDEQDLNNNNNDSNIEKKIESNNSENGRNSTTDSNKELIDKNNKIENQDDNGDDADDNDDDDDENEDEDEDEDEDDKGWITPSNLEQVKKSSIVESEQQDLNDLNIKVACMTSDFSMQVINIFEYLFLNRIRINCFF